MLIKKYLSLATVLSSVYVTTANANIRFSNDAYYVIFNVITPTENFIILPEENIDLSNKLSIGDYLDVRPLNIGEYSFVLHYNSEQLTTLTIDNGYGVINQILLHSPNSVNTINVNDSYIGLEDEYLNIFSYYYGNDTGYGDIVNKIGPFELN